MNQKPIPYVDHTVSDGRFLLTCWPNGFHDSSCSGLNGGPQKIHPPRTCGCDPVCYKVFPNVICAVVLCSVVQSRPTLCDPMECSPPGSSVHGTFQVRILEWVAISFSRGILPNPGMDPISPAMQADSFPLSHPKSSDKCAHKRGRDDGKTEAEI